MEIFRAYGLTQWYNLVVDIVRDDEPVVDEKASVAFAPVGVKYLVAYLNVGEALDDEPIELVRIVPSCLFG